jgi:hypothetical protein
MVALQDSDLKDVSRHCVNQHKLGTCAIECNQERVDFVVAWDCLDAPKRQLAMVRKPFDAVELLVAIEDCTIQPVLSQAASIEHFFV